MLPTELFRKMALSLPDTEEMPHFERTSFRVGKKIFATLAEDTKTATLKFSKPDQSAFHSINKTAIYPVPNNRGEKGWTFVELENIPEELMIEMLSTACNTVKKR